MEYYFYYEHYNFLLCPTRYTFCGTDLSWYRIEREIASYIEE